MLANVKQLLMRFYLSVCLCALIPVINQAMASENNDELAKTDFHQKYYQQALYYYFQGNYPGALDIIIRSKSSLSQSDINKETDNALKDSAQLFAAGLQVKLGLHEEAIENLLLISNKQLADNQAVNIAISHEQNTKKNQYKASSEQLLVLVLLSLSEQYIAQGELSQARKTLAKITKVSKSYYQQYHVLSQLAFWPAQPTLLPPTVENNVVANKSSGTNVNLVVDDSPYVQLNKALRFINQGEFEQAITLLNHLKTTAWQTPDKSFFQSLFTGESPAVIDLGKQSEVQIQHQAINDYARLLLAHLYAQKQSYGNVYAQLKTFPKHSPYTEPALYLYAFSAQQTKQNTTALALLTFLHEQYPTSTLGWQASLLMAKQVTEQRGLAPGWRSYQYIESFFLNTIEKLNTFETLFADSSDLLTFSRADISLKETKASNFNTSAQASIITTAKRYEPKSIWLQQAMQDATLASLYQQLSEVSALLQHSQALQDKSDNIDDIIELNISKKSRISNTQNTLMHRDLYKKLTGKREKLASKLSIALNDPKKQGFAFADEEEQAWLERIEQSKQSLLYIDEHSHKVANANYHQRLNRINSVLAWRLAQQFPQQAWHHKQLLAKLDNSLQQVKRLQDNVTRLLAESSTGQSHTSLAPFINRQKIAEAKITPLINRLETLKAKLSLSIRDKVTLYFDEQRSLLAQHILTSRKAMVSVLERMSESENNTDKQLSLEGENIKELVL